MDCSPPGSSVHGIFQECLLSASPPTWCQAADTQPRPRPRLPLQPGSTQTPRATPGLTRCTQCTAPWIPVPQLPWGPPSSGGSSDRQIAAGVSRAGSGPRGHPRLESPHTRSPRSPPPPPLRGDSTVAQPWHHPLRDPQPVTPTLTRVLDVAHDRHFNLKILAGRVRHVHDVVAAKDLVHQGVGRGHADT